ncbi:hypothetical protein [Streptococcus sanguinis]|jgi:hypothetical protein|uniref:Uncharacterized protein n=1 Tax=Streptococcus sanguinis SK330 TaxID=888813 RepID=F2C9W1_STRSA|nr:hypothetical protein [Streptococcus sanguinis]EGF13493.1 hypothetical protein HMPREF9386_1967 [Streptococcus sanguinis SK330]
MSETIIITVISSSISVISTLLGAFVTQAFNIRNENLKEKKARQKENLEIKRENLYSIYKKLIQVISLFPRQTPLDVLRYMEYSPNYYSENFDIINNILDIQIEDYKKRLSNPKLDYKLEAEYEIEIHNREYYKKEIIYIRDSYFKAKNEYEKFIRNEKIDFELYAGDEVKNKLVIFEVLVHNAFVAGRHLENENGDTNQLDKVRWQLINSIRNDLGIQ